MKGSYEIFLPSGVLDFVDDTNTLFDYTIVSPNNALLRIISM